MEPIFSMKGVSEVLDVYEDKISITPKGFMGVMTKGLKGTKTIPFSSITAIQFKKAGSFFSGYIQFTIPGGNESKGGVFAAANDENTFMFANKKNNDLASEIKDYIESSIQKVHNSNSKTSSTENISDELLKLSRLKEQGLLTDDEFQKAKHKIIGE